MQRVGDSIELRLEIAQPARTGARVVFRLVAHNLSSRTLELHLAGREPTFDVVVSRSDGSMVWRRLEGEVLPAIAHVRLLAPGDSVATLITWNRRDARGRAVGPGGYFARGFLLVDGPPLVSPEVPFEIPSS